MALFQQSLILNRTVRTTKYVRYSSKAMSQALASYDRVTSDLQGCVESPYFSKGIIQKSFMHFYTIVHDTAGNNNPLQWFSLFQGSVLLYLQNTREYKNHHNSLTV